MGLGLQKGLSSGGGGGLTRGTVVDGSSGKPKKHGHGILHNLLTDAEDFAKGTFTGTVALGKAVAHDTKDAVDGGPHHFMLDDVGKAIGADYAQRYGALFHGDIKGFARQVKEHPLSFLMDATMFAGGAGGVLGKVGEAAAEAGQAGRLTRAAGFVARDAIHEPSGLTNLERAQRAYGVGSKEIRQGEKAGLVRGVREVGQKAVDEGRISKTVLKPGKTNVVLRRRDALVDRAIGSHHALEKAPIVGLNSQVAKDTRRMPGLERDLRDHAIAQVEKQVRGLSPAERVAWDVLHEGVDPLKRADRIEKEIPDLAKADRAKATEAVKLLRSDAVVSAVREPSERLQGAVDATRSFAKNELSTWAQKTGLSERDLIEREHLPQRLTDGAKMVTEHPTKVRPTAAAEDAGKQADALELERLRGGDGAQASEHEVALREAAKETQSVPLSELDGYHAAEPMNPATGALYRDENAHLSDAEYAARSTGAYRPHMAPQEGRAGGVLRTDAASKRRPGAPSNVSNANTGRRFLTGTDETGPLAFLRSAQRLSRSAHASDLYDKNLDWAVPYDHAAYIQGGKHSWVVMDTKGVTGLSQRLDQARGSFQELEGLLPSEDIASVVEKLSEKGAALAKKGEKDPEGLVMIPRAIYDKAAGDLHQSSQLAHAVIDRPLDVFRTLVLFTRPAYYANNLVGQNLLLAVKDSGPLFLPKYVQFLASKNLGAARDLFRTGVNDQRTGLRLWDPVFDKFGGPLKSAQAGVVETRGARAVVQGLTHSNRRSARAFGRMLRAPQTANELGAILTDDLPRQFRFIRIMQPHIAAARKAGVAGDDASVAMHLLESDPVLHERVLQQTLSDLVDYRGMSKFERTTLRRIVPFYGWLRGITTWTTELGYNHPDELMKLAGVSKIGQAENADFAANTPAWMSGSVQLGAPHAGIQRVLNTSGLNPLGTIADEAGIAKLLLSDDPSKSLANGSAFGQVNPYAQAFLAALNGGKQIGSPYKMLMPGQTTNAALAGKTNNLWRTLPGATLGGFLASTPQNQLLVDRRAQAINERAGLGKVVTSSGVYQSPFRDYALSFFGVPVRNVNLQAAAAKRAQDDALLAGEGRTF